MKARRLALLALAMLALVGAGCGGDDTSDTSADANSTVVTETTGDDTNDVEDLTETTGDDDIGQLEGKCAELAGIGAKLSQSLSGQSGDLDEASRVFDEIADEVPDEIKADYEVIAENFGKIAEALKDVDLQSGETPNAEAIAKLQQLATSFDSPEIREATANIEAWTQKNC